MNKRVVVCLCGSTRFKKEYIEANFKETLAGKIVLSVGCFNHDDGVNLTDQEKAALDELNLDKIDMADEVLVINPYCQVCPRCLTVWQKDLGENRGLRVLTCSCGFDLKILDAYPYIGESTRREIAYAEGKGKTVRYLFTKEQS